MPKITINTDSIFNWVGKIVSTLLITAVGWQYYTTNELQLKTNTLEVEVANLKGDIEDDKSMHAKLWQAYDKIRNKQ